MGTFVYAPGAEIRIGTERWGIIDVSDDCIAGMLQINVNRQHEVSFTLSNPKHKYDGVFMPNDRITIKLKRQRWLQVFSGYLNKVPVVSTWPGSVNFTASCTLKILANRLYDSGAIATTDLFNRFVSADPDSTGTSTDGNLSERAIATLVEMGEWPEDKIHIAELPNAWWATVSDLWTRVRPVLESSIIATVESGASIYGSGTYAPVDGAMVNSSNDDPSIMGPSSMTASDLVDWWTEKHGSNTPVNGSREDICNWYITIGASEGVRGDLAFIQATVETGWFSGATSHWRDKFNPAGIGAYDNSPGSSHGYGTPQEGILAHIQLLKKVVFGNEVALSNADVAATWGGTNVQTLNGLTRNWATDSSYGTTVGNRYRAALENSGKTTQGSGTTPPTPASQYNPASGAPTTPASQYNPNSGSAGTGWVFPAPGYKADMSDNFGADRSWNRPPGASDTTHDGVDIGCPNGSVIVAAMGGTVTRIVSDVGSSAGRNVKITDANGDTFTYMHLSSIAANLVQGGPVAKGQQIGLSGSSGAREDSYSPHLHFEWRPGGGEESDPYDILVAAADDGTVPADPMLSSNFATQEYTDLSASLVGPRMLLNDQGSSVLNLAGSFLAAGMRDYCSAPNGDFISWYPDYFGTYNMAAKLVLEDIELTDFSLGWSDDGFVTHQFVVGSIAGYGGDVQPDEAVTKMLTTMGVATIEFPEILEALLGPNAPDWTQAEAIMERFGPRVDKQDYAAVISPEAEFYMAVKLFAENWAKQFRSTVDISFMPELWPGMILQIPSRGVQFYVEQVTHNWSYTSGFTTSISIIAPASLDGSLPFLPRAGDSTDGFA